MARKSVVTILGSNFHVAHMGPSWVLSAPGGFDVGPMNLAMRDGLILNKYQPISETNEDERTRAPFQYKDFRFRY